MVPLCVHGHSIDHLLDMNRSIQSVARTTVKNLAHVVCRLHLETREGCFKTKHSCGFIFSKLWYKLIYLMHIFSIN